MILIKSFSYLLYYQINFRPFFQHGFSLKFITLLNLSIFIRYCSRPPEILHFSFTAPFSLLLKTTGDLALIQVQFVFKAQSKVIGLLNLLLTYLLTTIDLHWFSTLPWLFWEEYIPYYGEQMQDFRLN